MLVFVAYIGEEGGSRDMAEGDWLWLVGIDKVWKCIRLLGFCGVVFLNLFLCLGIIFLYVGLSKILEMFIFWVIVIFIYLGLLG